jgi:large subunit ribosomal protein L9
MKVILEKDIPNVGQAGQVREVSDGYVRNFLLPRRLAKLATPAGIARAERQSSQRTSQDKKHNLRTKDLIAKLTGMVLTFDEKANEQGHLFASVNKAAIIKSLHQKTGASLDESSVELEQPIKIVGQQTINIIISGQTIQCIIDVRAKA